MKRSAKRSNRRVLAAALGILSALLLAGTGAYLVGEKLEHSGNPEARGDVSYRYERKIAFEKDGVAYAERQNVDTILLMGIDSDGEEHGPYDKRSGGQADLLQLIVIDRDNETVRRLVIDRDTMTPITILGVLGNRSGIRTAQICLAHGFGDGKEESCLLTVEAVSNLLYNIEIDNYAAVDLRGIPVLNDLVGGVTMTMDADYTDINPAWVEGTTVTFDGTSAERFVRARLTTAAKTNAARMDRQEDYIELLTDALLEKERASQSFAGEAFDVLDGLMVTDMSRGKLANRAWSVRDYEIADTVQIVGEHKVGSDGFMQFIPDEASLEDTMINLFFEPYENVDPKG